MSEMVERLSRFLESRQQSPAFESLTADASTREYFRIDWNGEKAVACVYPEPFDAAEHTYLDVTRLFIAADLPVAEIYEAHGELGIIVQEDLGDRILREIFIEADEERRTRLQREAISLIARIQRATPIAFETNSVASKHKFDSEKLLWELNFFKTHYFETYLKKPLTDVEN